MSIAADNGPLGKLRVFVSYGHDEHSELAEKLRLDLLERGHEVWFDQTELTVGEDWELQIETGLDWLAEKRDRARMIVLMTPHSVRRPDGYCLNEIARAVSRRIGIIPVMVAQCEPPLSICRIQHLDMSRCTPVSEKESEYAESLRVLLGAIEGKGPDVEGFAARKATVLNPIDFSVELAAHKDFVGRGWILKELDSWIRDPDGKPVFTLVAPPGFGKSALAVEVIHQSGHVTAFHICNHSNQEKNDSKRLVMSLAHQISTQMPTYDAVLKTLDLDYVVNEYDAATLFDVLLATPCGQILPPGRTMVIVIDGLDEATKDGRNPVAEFVADRAATLPNWIRILVTTRPEPEVLGPLEPLGLHRVDPLDLENRADVQDYLRARIGEIDAPAAAHEHAVDVVAERSSGVMLYARSACEMLHRDGISEESLNALPDGLSSLYYRQFSARFPDVDRYGFSVRPILSLLIAAFQPIGFDLLAASQGTSEDELWQSILGLGSLVVDNGDSVTLHHKTLRDWLSDRRAAHRYFVSEDAGHRLLASATAEWKKVPREARQYLFKFGPRHLLHERDWDGLFRVIREPRFAEGRMQLLDDTIRDPTKTDLLLDLVEHLVDSDESGLLDVLIDRLHVAVELGLWHSVMPIVDEVMLDLTSGQRNRIGFLRAWSLQMSGDLERAVAAYEDLGDDVDDPDGHIAFRRADAVREAGNFDEAFETYRDLQSQAEAPVRLQILYGQQYADLLYVRGQYQDALDALNTALERGHRGAPEMFAEALRIRGHIHRVMLDSQEALADYAEAREIFSEIGHRSGIARIETNLAEVYALTDPDRGIWHAEQAAHLNGEVGANLEVGKAIRAKGLALAARGSYGDSRSVLDVAESRLTEVGYAAGVCETQANRVVLHVLEKSIDDTRDLIVSLAGRLKALNAYPLLVVRSCILLGRHEALDSTLAAIERTSADAIQWPITRDDYANRLLAGLGLL